MEEGAAAPAAGLAERDELDRATRGDAEAFEALVRRHQRRLRAYLSACVRDLDLADDLAQEVFLAAFKSLPQRDPGAPFLAWLLGIARNRVRWHRRDEGVERGRRRDRIAALFELGGADPSADPAHEEATLLALERCLEGLPPPAASLVREHYFARRSLADLAREGGRKESALRMALLRVRQLLRGCVQRRLGGAP
jgi:RNA polymerase sigma-70 factor (ECF subfamily)